VRGLAPFAWRSLAARPARTLLTIVGIGLGVAVLAAALVTTAGIDDAVERTVTEVAGRADLTVTAFEDAGLSPASVTAAGELAGVEVAAPSIERRTTSLPA
jgi:ABC-type lipoprotein release transport system permease subunit